MEIIDWDQRRYRQEEADEVFRLHEMWLRREAGGVRADLSNCDLRGIDFRASFRDLNKSYARRAVNLSYATLKDCNLSGCDLCYVDFEDTDLEGAALDRVDLSNSRIMCANLTRSYLGNADLTQVVAHNCDFTNANLSRVLLEEADCSYSIFRSADLMGIEIRDTDMSNCDFQNAEFYGVDLSGAYLEGAMFDVIEDFPKSPNLRILEAARSAVQPPTKLPSSVRRAISEILCAPRKRGDFRRHLETLCVFVGAGSFRAAGNGNSKHRHQGPRRDIRELQEKLGCELIRETNQSRTWPLEPARPTDVAKMIVAWLNEHQDLLADTPIYQPKMID